MKYTTKKTNARDIQNFTTCKDDNFMIGIVIKRERESKWLFKKVVTTSGEAALKPWSAILRERSNKYYEVTRLLMIKQMIFWELHYFTL